MAEKRLTCWGEVDPLMAAYHDDEWAVPCHDDTLLFERLMLEAFQAGLSWSTILNKRESFRAAFHGWDAATIAAYGDDDIERLLADPGIVRNRLKIRAAMKNSAAFLRLQAEHGSFAEYIWRFAPPDPPPPPASFRDVPARTAESDAMSKALKGAGMTFVGSTICYAFMQATGLVNDHLADCPARSVPSAAGHASS